MKSILTELKQHKDGEYVVARRVAGLSIIFIFIILVGLACLVAGIALGVIGFGYYVPFFVVPSLVFLAIGVTFTVRFFLTPRIAIKPGQSEKAETAEAENVSDLLRQAESIKLPEMPDLPKWE